MKNIVISVGKQSFEAELFDTPSAQALAKQLPLIIEMDELNGNEKYHYLRHSLPQHEQAIHQIHAGDLMLFGNSCLVLFYEDFHTSYSYTPLGRLKSPLGLSQALGTGRVTVKIESSKD